MSLMDKYLSKYDFHEVHFLDIQGTDLITCYESAMNLDLSKSRISKLLFTLRGLPTKDLSLAGFTRVMKFTLLEQRRPEEFIYGFWLYKQVEWIDDKEAFASTAPAEANAKVVWHFSFQQINADVVRARTETRVRCLNRRTKFWFSIYWFFIKPFSGLIMREMLRLIKGNVQGGFEKGNLT